MSNHSFYPFLREGATASRRDSANAMSGVKQSPHPVVFPSSPAQTSSSASQSSVSNSPSLSSVSTNITTPSPSPKPGLSTPTPTRTPRIPALTGKGARRPLPNGETLTASQVAIPVAPPSLHNPNALDVHLSTRFRSSVSVSAASAASKTYVEEERPTTPVSRGPFGYSASLSSSRQQMSFATPQVPSNSSPLPPPPSYSSLPLSLPPPPGPSPSPPPPLMNPTSPQPQPELEPMTKEDELIAECMQPSIPQPTTHGVWRIPKEEIPANCHRTHPDSKRNRRIWSTEQQLKLVDKGYKADITIVSNIFMRDGYIIDWKTRFPVYPHTLELATEQSRQSTRKRHEPHRLGDEASPPVKKKKISDGLDVNPHNVVAQTQPVQKAKPGRPRKTSKEHAASTDPPAPVDGRPPTAELSLQYPIDDVHAPSPSHSRQKAKRGRRSQVEQLHASLGDHLADSTLLSLRTDDLPPGRITRSRSKQLSETRLTAEPQPPSAQSSDYGEDEEIVERMLEVTGSPSSSSADEGPEKGQNRSPPSSDDDMYLPWSEHARIYSRGAVEPPDPPRRPQEGSSRAQDMRIAIPTFVYRDRHQDKNP